MDINRCEFINLKTFKENNGHLTCIEEKEGLPFDIKRIYYLHNLTTKVKRGVHAHKKLEQLLICISGSCILTIDDGIKRKTIILDSPTQGVYICPMIWRELGNFSKDAVLLILASTKYDPDDYIHEYNDFLKLIKR